MSEYTSLISMIKKQKAEIEALKQLNSVIPGMQEKIDLYREQLADSSAEHKKLVDKQLKAATLLKKGFHKEALKLISC